MEDIRNATENLQRLLLHYEQNTQGATDLLKQVNDLKRELKEANDEKIYWKEKYQELAKDMGYVSPPEHFGGRKRTNSELQVIADTMGYPGEGIESEDDAPTPIENWRLHSSEDLTLLEIEKLDHRSSFRLLQCSDEQCEVFTPRHRSIRTQHRAKNNVQLMWDSPPKTVLIVKKPNEPIVTNAMVRLSKWLIQVKKMRVYAEPIVWKVLHSQVHGLLTWSQENEEDWKYKQLEIDFIVSLGGDGTVLWVSSLFKMSVPPVISFAMGSLGFLTPFEIEKSSGMYNK